MSKAFLWPLLFGWGAIQIGSCAQNPQVIPPGETPSTSTNPCNAHDLCDADQLCFRDGTCAPPWASYFELTACSFEGPAEPDFAGCQIHCRWMNATSGAAQWNFFPKKWRTFESNNRVQAIKTIRAKVRSMAILIANGDKFPDQPLVVDYCLSKECPGFEIDRYRSKRTVKLKNSQGHTLKFWIKDLEN